MQVFADGGNPGISHVIPTGIAACKLRTVKIPYSSSDPLPKKSQWKHIAINTIYKHSSCDSGLSTRTCNNVPRTASSTTTRRRPRMEISEVWTSRRISPPGASYEISAGKCAGYSKESALRPVSTYELGFDCWYTIHYQAHSLGSRLWGSRVSACLLSMIGEWPVW